MTRPLHIAHQFGADRHDWLRARLPAGTRIDRLGPDDPWGVAEGASVVLVGNGMLRRLSRLPPAWAGGVEWMHVRPTGLDDAPDWLFGLPYLTVSRGASAPAIAEYVMAAVLDAEKGLAALRVTSRDQWRAPGGGSLEGRSLGLVGYGEIGRAIAERARAFGMVVRATRRTQATAPDGVALVPLPILCAESDHLVLCAPLTEATRGLFGAATFGHCRPGQHLINVARGALIEPEALRAALEGPIARATLDVWAEEPPPEGHWVYVHPRVVLTPHCASRAPSTERRLQAILDANLTAWLEGRPDAMTGSVNRAGRY
ncbi:MAG: glyoxylate reductase (NADP(+)) [Paracoccaceae bacterium]|nr:MAG: glyoxylate reductase (NADP(+)) [Paracoccaceae bacterium]